MTYRIAFVLAAALPAALVSAEAQVIAVKTAPVADGGQFEFLPSANLGMGGLSIALADSSLDPFVNPAKGARVTGSRVFGAPTFFSVTRKAGGGLTIPLGAIVSRGPWFSQVAVAMQDVDRTDVPNVPVPVAVDDVSRLGGVAVAGTAAGNRSRQNQYAQGIVGRRLSNGLSVATSASYWRLNALDGVDLYYNASNVGIRQHGGATDVRLGVLEDRGHGRSIEAVALYNRFAMTEDVSFTDPFWDPTLRQIVGIPRVRPNADETETWGLHVAYMRPLADSAWRVGAVVTANRIQQPRLPAYDLPVVPAEAGRAQAYNVGAGIARSAGGWTAGLDAIYEPIWSRTWTRAAEPTTVRDGTLLAAGASTLENRFRFQNAVARLGVAAPLWLGKSHELTLEAGGQLHAFRYRLHERDAVEQSVSASTQHWNEWTRTWGLTARFAGASLRYRGRLTSGASRPGIDTPGNIVFAPTAAAAPTPTFAPPVGGFGPAFAHVRATTHQISFSIPIR